MSNKDPVLSHPSFATNRNNPADRLAKMQEMAVGATQHQQNQQQPPQDFADQMSAGDIRQLIYLGKIQDSITIGGFIFELRTLDSMEQDSIWMGLSFLPGENKLFVIRRPTLTRSIVSVNGRPLEDLYEEMDYKDLSELERKTRVVAKWQGAVIDKLYDFYAGLVDRSRKVIDPEEIKK